MLKRNCCASVGGLSRAGGDGGCVAGLSVVWCAHSGCGCCALFPVGRCRTLIIIISMLIQVEPLKMYKSIYPILKP